MNHKFRALCSEVLGRTDAELRLIMGKLEKAGVGIVVVLLGVILTVALLGGGDPPATKETAEQATPIEPASLSAVRVVDSTTPGAVVEANDLAAAPVVTPNVTTELVPAPVAVPVTDVVNVPVVNGTGVGTLNTVAPAVAKASKEVVVKSGDSLWKIAAREVSSREVDSYIKDIREANGLAANARLKVGSKLKLPAHAGESAAAVSAPATGPEARPFEAVKTVSVLEGPAVAPVVAVAGTREYTVKKGDMLALIAQRECGSVKLVSDIMKLNGLKDGNVLKIGQKLQLPARAR